MEVTHERQLNGSNDGAFAPPDHTDELDNIGGEPLEGSGFDDETPEPDFEEGQ